MTDNIKEAGDAGEPKPAQKDPDMAKIQASMQGLREQQEKELRDDIDTFDKRHKPAGHDTQTPPGGPPDVPPLSNDALNEIMRIQSLPVKERQQAVADFRNSKAGKQAGDLNGGVMRDGKGVYFRDADGNQHDINYEEDQKNTSS